MNAVIVVLNVAGLSTAQQIIRDLPGAEIHASASRVALEHADLLFDDALTHIRQCFAQGRTLIGVCSAGILVRAIAPLLQDKHCEPPVIAVAVDGSSVVPLVAGHRGANDLARAIAQTLDGHAAITTAGDMTLGVALDAPPTGWKLANPAAAKAVMARLVGGEAVAVNAELDWLAPIAARHSEHAALRLTATLYMTEPCEQELVYHPARIIIGVGSDRGCPPDEAVKLVEETLSSARFARHAVSCVVSIERKADEAAVHAVAEHFGVPARFLSAAAINEVAGSIPNPSEIVQREVGVPGVAEGAALAASNTAKLVVQKQKTARATCAIAVADEIVRPDHVGRSRGSIAIVGVGPGMPAWRSAECVALLRASSDWVGYNLYLDLVQDLKCGQSEHRFALGDEELRVRHALELAGRGRNVALVCSGDAGIYAMAALVCEVMALDPSISSLSDGAHRVAVTVAPGISAFQAAAARAGAPIGHDFCCISLSDLLTPWSVIERRIHAAAEGDFVVAFYNPRSMRRHDQLERAIAILKKRRPAETPVILAANLGRPTENYTVTPLSCFATSEVDMLSLVMVGSSTTQTFTAGDGRQLVFTPRGYAAKREAAK